MWALRKLTRRRQPLLGGLALLLLGVGLFSTYSVVRYGFLATPKFLADSFPSSRFLEKTLRGESKSIFSIAFSPDGTFVASGGDRGRITIWDLATGRSIHILEVASDQVDAVAFSPNGQVLASHHRIGDIVNGRRFTQLWNLTTGKVISILEQGNPPFGSQSFAFSADSKQFVGIDRSGKLTLIEVTTGATIRTVKPDRAVYAISSNFDSKTLTYATFNTVRQLNFTTGKDIRLAKMQDLVLSSALSADGKWLALARSVDAEASNRGKFPQAIELWDVSTQTKGKKIRTLKGNDDWLDSLAFSPDGQTLASASADGMIKLWRVTIGEAMQPLQGHQSRMISSLSVAFSPDGKLLASGSRVDGTIKLWRVPY
ncbi:MAG: WD40 repeat domain-containing protein [Tildeniella nuda ZEHNDER 1965/U140]|jgi:WD40 repeat protein|nr:WD40 repeat domain-containing protein [Tildeniella nuda ZEHNDER 1965/U140]